MGVSGEVNFFFRFSAEISPDYFSKSMSGGGGGGELVVSTTCLLEFPSYENSDI